MTFFSNLFSNNDPLAPSTSSPSSPTSPTTTSEKKNAAALKALIKSHKHALRAEYSRLVLDYKLALDAAAQEHKRARKQAEEVLQHRSVEAVRARMEVIAGSEEVLRADDKTKGLFVEFQKSWMGAAVGAGVELADVGTDGGAGIGKGAVGEIGREGEGGMTVIMQEFGTGTMEIEGFLVQDTYSSSSSPVSVGTEKDARVTFTI
ncbi:hypothetical protein BGZ96_003432 [Linnemannia gamsii]|uniref:Uncharacterized protein n=1 Tax=Linnemannia gamsii TaxID=64522 RepID=A0ABQ7JJ90_9FUNG|nr:hypothetical protein BGZ96_003432 [Linnemannia gamsii]